MAEKLNAAKEYLGEAWVYHPRYDPAAHPAHRSKHPQVLKTVELTARAAGRL